MTDPVKITLIGSATTALIGLWNGWVLLKVHSQSKSNGKGLDVVLEKTNGLQDKLLAAEKIVSHQEGMAEQRESDKRKQL